MFTSSTQGASLSRDQVSKLGAIVASPEFADALIAHEAARAASRMAILASMRTAEREQRNTEAARQALIAELQPRAEELRQQLQSVLNQIGQADQERGVACMAAERAVNRAKWHLQELGGKAISETRSHLIHERMATLNMSGQVTLPRNPKDGALKFFEGAPQVSHVREKRPGEHGMRSVEVEVKTFTPAGGVVKFPEAATRLEVIDTLLAEVDALELSDHTPEEIETRCAEMVAETSRPRWMPQAVTRTMAFKVPAKTS